MYEEKPEMFRSQAKWSQKQIASNKVTSFHTVELQV